MQNKWNILLASTIAAVMISGCAKEPTTFHNGATPKPRLSTGAQTDMIENLKQGDVEVAQLGEKIRFILPTDVFFASNSATLRPEHLSTLSTLASLLRSYHDAHIIVRGHSDNVTAPKVAAKLTDAQANQLAAFLWSKGVPLYDMKISGKANTQTIAGDNTVGGSAMNRRVEVLVQLFPVS